jgi:hypothetical protein
LETDKGRLEQVHSKSIEVLKEHTTMQVVETLTKKSAQAKIQVYALTKKF